MPFSEHQFFPRGGANVRMKPISYQFLRVAVCNVCKKLSVASFWALISFCAGPPCEADTLFNNFGPNNGLDQGGRVVSGNANTNLWAGEAVQTAASFTSAFAGTLSQIHIALQIHAGANAFLVSLNQDLNGVPGSTLEEWEIRNVGDFGDGGPAYGGFETVASTAGTLLQAGKTYWLTASPLDFNSTTDGAWRGSPIDLGLTDQQVNGGGWQSFGGYRPAFSVEAAPVPEPSCLHLFGAGVIGLIAVGTKKARRELFVQTMSEPAAPRNGGPAGTLASSAPSGGPPSVS